MDVRAEGLPWERQPREGERAYAAFLAYRDLGWRRSHEATRVQLGKGPGYLKPIERWSALRDWRWRACAWEASGPAARPGIRGSTASVGVRPIQCRWNTFSLPGSSSESAYERASPPNHHVRSNFRS